MAASLLFTIVSFVAERSQKTPFATAKEIIIMRDIAHRVLRYTGDSSSTVPAIKRIADNEFEIPFAKSFAFKPDSLVQIIDRVLRGNYLPDSYIVNVIESKSEDVIFGYAVLGKNKKNIVPCLGRQQAKQQYSIIIKFDDTSKGTGSLYLWGLGLLGIGFIAFVAGRFKKKAKSKMDKSEAVPNNMDAIHIGQYTFRPDELLLLLGAEKITLTLKEAKLLSILASDMNKIVDRNRLQKEVWEDEGVIVGRSLDMFISKLRKKLEQDPQVKITNLHGKGYKLEVV